MLSRIKPISNHNLSTAKVQVSTLCRSYNAKIAFRILIENTVLAGVHAAETAREVAGGFGRALFADLPRPQGRVLQPLHRARLLRLICFIFDPSLSSVSSGLQGLRQILIEAMLILKVY